MNFPYFPSLFKYTNSQVPIFLACKNSLSHFTTKLQQWWNLLWRKEVSRSSFRFLFSMTTRVTRRVHSQKRAALMTMTTRNTTMSLFSILMRACLLTIALFCYRKWSVKGHIPSFTKDCGFSLFLSLFFLIIYWFYFLDQPFDCHIVCMHVPEFSCFVLSVGLFLFRVFI